MTDYDDDMDDIEDDDYDFDYPDDGDDDLDSPFAPIEDDYDAIDDDEPDGSDWHNIMMPDEYWYDLRCTDILERVSIFYVARHLVTWFWAWKVTGPFYRLRKNVARRFKRCAYCGKRGCGPYWFSDVCSEACSRALYERRVANSKKLHIIDTKHKGRFNNEITLCGEWTGIWSGPGIKCAPWDEAIADQFCTVCTEKRGK